MRTAVGLLALSALLVACSKPETNPPPPPPDPVCGNGLLESGETCEGNPVPEGCNADSCTVEEGYTCEPVPPPGGGGGGDESGGSGGEAPSWMSTCELIDTCGDGVVDAGEQCDDGNLDNNDGCSECQVDDGFGCTPDENGTSVCHTCGDGWLDANLDEECDPGDLLDPNNPVYGCTDCQILDGWACEGQPSLCGPICGDGIWIDKSLPGVTIGVGEECDDGNTDNGDGCNSDCVLEAGCECTGVPPMMSTCNCGGETTGTGTDTDTDTGTDTDTDTDTTGSGSDSSSSGSDSGSSSSGDVTTTTK